MLLEETNVRMPLANSRGVGAIPNSKAELAVGDASDPPTQASTLDVGLRHHPCTNRGLNSGSGAGAPGIGGGPVARLCETVPACDLKV